MVQTFLKKLGVVAFVSYVLQGVMFLVLWLWIGYSFVDAGKISWVASWVILPLIPIVMYFVKKKYHRRQ